METETQEYRRPEPTIEDVCDKSDCTRTFEHGHASYDRLKDGKVVETVYLCRDCSDERRLLEFQKSGDITTHLLMEFAMDKSEWKHARRRAGPNAMVSSTDLNLSLPHEVYRHIETFQNASNSLIEEFRRRHWMGSLCQQIYDAVGGLSGEGDGFKVLAMAMAGRALVTIQDSRKADDPEAKYGGAMVSLIAEDGRRTSTMGIQGICATRDEGVGLLHAATYHMPELTPDKEVGLGF